MECARRAHTDGIPMMRAMVVEFPQDPACTHLERQYMLGGDLLVAPVFSADGDVSYYTPDGTWTHFLTGERLQGPRWVTERHDFMSVPLLVRPGAVVPVGAVDDRPDYDYAEGVTLRVYQLPEGARVTTAIPAASGEQESVFVTSRDGDVVRVEAAAARPGWKVLLVGVHTAAGVAGGTATRHDQGLLVEAERDTLVVTLEPTG
jgi:alpha-D-xyloside xylohydrolase